MAAVYFFQFLVDNMLCSQKDVLDACKPHSHATLTLWNDGRGGA